MYLTESREATSDQSSIQIPNQQKFSQGELISLTDQCSNSLLIFNPFGDDAITCGVDLIHLIIWIDLIDQMAFRPILIWAQSSNRDKS